MFFVYANQDIPCNKAQINTTNMILSVIPEFPNTPKLNIMTLNRL